MLLIVNPWFMYVQIHARVYTHVYILKYICIFVYLLKYMCFNIQKIYVYLYIRMCRYLNIYLICIK